MQQRPNRTVCPHLGLLEDPQTYAGFPSERNACHRVSEPAPVATSHQQAFCLTGNFQACPVFVAKEVRRLPPELRARHTGGQARRHPSLRLLAAVLILLGLGGLLGLWLVEPALFATWSAAAPPPATRPTGPSPVPPSPYVVSQGARPTQSTAPTTPEASPLPSPTASPADTPTPTPPPGLETPMGPSGSLLIHRMLPGENLTLVAERYETSVEAIQAVNYFLPSPVWEGWLVVVPLGTTDVADLPPFEVYRVVLQDMTVEDLARQLGADAEAIRRYNGLSAGARLVAGQWLLIPRERQPGP